MTPSTTASVDTLDPETRGLVDLTAAIRTLDVDASPSPAFQRRLRQRLVVMSAIAADDADGTAHIPSPRTPLPQRVAVTRRRVHRRLIAAAAMLVALALVGGISVAEASRALPGDLLYGLKRATENVQLSFTRGDEAKGMKQLGYATNRLHEVGDLIDKDSGVAIAPTTHALTPSSDERVVSTLNEMDRETRDGIKLVTTAAVVKDHDSSLATVQAWTRTQSADVATVLTKLSGSAATRSRASLGLLQQVDTRVSQLRGNLKCTCLATEGNTDSLGPRPCSPCAEPSKPTSSDSASVARSSGAASGSGPTPSGSGATGPSGSVNASLPPASLATRTGVGGPISTQSVVPSAGPTGPGGGLLPSGILPPGPDPTGLTPTGLLPSGILPTDILPSLLPSGILPSGLLPNGLLPSGILPTGLPPLLGGH